MGVYLVSDGTSKPYRVHIKAPGFIHLVSRLYSFRFKAFIFAVNRLPLIVLLVVICSRI